MNGLGKIMVVTNVEGSMFNTWQKIIIGISLEVILEMHAIRWEQSLNNILNHLVETNQVKV